MDLELVDGAGPDVCRTGRRVTDGPAGEGNVAHSVPRPAVWLTGAAVLGTVAGKGSPEQLAVVVRLIGERLPRFAPWARKTR